MFYIQPAGVQVWVPEQQPVQSLAAAPVEHPLGVHRHAGAAVVAGAAGAAVVTAAGAGVPGVVAEVAI